MDIDNSMGRVWGGGGLSAGGQKEEKWGTSVIQQYK